MTDWSGDRRSQGGSLPPEKGIPVELGSNPSAPTYSPSAAGPLPRSWAGGGAYSCLPTSPRSGGAEALSNALKTAPRPLSPFTLSSTQTRAP